MVCPWLLPLALGIYGKVRECSRPTWFAVVNHFWNGQRTGGAGFELVDQISPILQELDAFGPIVGTIIDAPNSRVLVR